MFPQNGDGIAGRLADAAARVFAPQPRAAADRLARPTPAPAAARAALRSTISAPGATSCSARRSTAGSTWSAIGRPLPTLFSLPEQAWRSPDVMTMGFAAAREAGLEVGILRAERALHRPADVRAAVADPLLPEGVGKILRRTGMRNESRRPMDSV